MTSKRRPAVSVLVPTYNPRLSLLNWTLDGLARQSLVSSDFEVVIVDNNSTPPLERAHFKWDSDAELKIVREPRQGLVYARITGLAAASADLIVFVDDDNQLDASYLEEAVRIARDEASIGCFGGIARPVLEGRMKEWKRPLLAYLGTRDYGGKPITSTRNHWGEWEPIGAGMVCRRAVAEEFAHWVRVAPPAARLDRKGRGWMSGSDTLLAMSAYRLGYACSYQPSLQLAHWIKAKRLGLAIAPRILFGHGRSFVILERLKGRAVERLTLPEAAGALWKKHRVRVQRHGIGAGTIEWFFDLGLQWEARRDAGAPEDAEWRAAWLRELDARQNASDHAIAQLTKEARDRLEALERADRALNNANTESGKRESALREVASAIEHRERRIAQAEAIAAERLEALQLADSALQKANGESEKRLLAMKELASVVVARERRIADLEAVAEERLEALQRADVALQAVGAEGEKRERGLKEFASIVQLRDRRVAELEVVAQERLEALQRTDQMLKAMKSRLESDDRARQVEQLHALAEERLAALEKSHEALKAVTAEATRRETALCEAALILEARDRRIAELEQMARERLEALQAADVLLHQAAAHAGERGSVRTPESPAGDLPRISIVIPNYNSGPLLERAIQSLLTQDYPNLQLIMADAGSDDFSRETIERYRHVFDPLLSRKDKGPADGLNKGFRCGNGDIFGWLCADDELLPGALHHVAELFRRSPQTDVVIGGCRRVYADGSQAIMQLPPDFWAVLGMKNCIEQPSVFWRASLQGIVGELDTAYDLAFDWDFWCRMKAARARVLTTNRLLSCYHFSATNKTSQGGRKHVDEQFRIIRKYGPLGAVLPILYRFLYLHFDLKGVYDSPPGCSRARVWLFGLTWSTLELLLGKRLMSLYNWRFASCQERHLKWW